MSFRHALALLSVSAMFVASPVLAARPYAPDQEQIIQSEILDSFENLDGWEVAYSIHGREVKPPDSALKLLEGHRPRKMLVTHGEENYVVGVRGDFRRMGYNFLELRRKDGQEIPIPGKVRSIDVWVWGGNFDYQLEIQLLDYQGISHTLPLGSLEYTGWRNLSVRVPEGIRHRTAKYYPKEPRADWIRFKKFVIWTMPYERMYGFYCYFDRMKAITDVFQLPFDGKELAEMRWKQ